MKQSGYGASELGVYFAQELGPEEAAGDREACVPALDLSDLRRTASPMVAEQTDRMDVPSCYKPTKTRPRLIDVASVTY